MQSFMSLILVYHQELAIIFVVPPRENIELIPDNDAIVLVLGIAPKLHGNKPIAHQ